MTEASPGANILLGVSGSIAAYKAADLASRLKKRGHSVTAILTRSACELISPNTFLNLTGNSVFTELFEPGAGQTEHIALTDRADLVVVAPATADLMAKMANGLANDLASAVLLATSRPVLIAPAMNPQMWANKATQRNLTRLAADVSLRRTLGDNGRRRAETVFSRGDTVRNFRALIEATVREPRHLDQWLAHAEPL